MISRTKIFSTLLLATTGLLAGCSTATYRIVDNNEKVVQEVTADAPVGETAVIVVYFSSDKAPLIKAGVDSSDLVNATAALGRQAVSIALRR